MRIEKWALAFSISSLLVSLATCVAALSYAASTNLNHMREIEHLKSQCVAANTLSQDVSLIRNWLIAVYERADKKGFLLPPLPEKESPDVSEKDSVQSPR